LLNVSCVFNVGFVIRRNENENVTDMCMTFVLLFFFSAELLTLFFWMRCDLFVSFMRRAKSVYIKFDKSFYIKSACREYFVNIRALTV